MVEEEEWGNLGDPCWRKKLQDLITKKDEIRVLRAKLDKE